MPNTKSAARRIRSSARKAAHNLSIKSRLKTLEARFLASAEAGKKEEAQIALRSITSALAKAAKTRVIHPAKSSRKASRLALRLNKIK